MVSVRSVSTTLAAHSFGRTAPSLGPLRSISLHSLSLAPAALSLLSLRSRLAVHSLSFAHVLLAALARGGSPG